MKGYLQPDIQKALRPFRTRQRLVNAVIGGGFGMLTAAIACAVLAVLSYFMPMAQLTLYMGTAAAGALVLFVLLVALMPVSSGHAAKAADGAGLCERAVTALHITGESPMVIIQREDALKHIRALSPKTALPMRIPPQPLFAAGGIALALTLALLLIPNPQRAVLQRQSAFQKTMTEKAQTVDKAAQELEKSPYTKEQVNELRKLMGDLALELREAREPQQAYLALDKAERDLTEFSREAASSAREAVSKAFEQNGMKDIAEALKKGDAQAAAQAVSQLANNGAATSQDAQNLQNAAEALPESDLKQAAQAAAAAMQSGSAASINASLSSLSSAAQGTCSAGVPANINALLSQLRVGAQAASAGQGSGGQGQGQGQGQGSGGQGGTGQGVGTGAGKGSTNQDAGVSQGGPASNGQGANAPEYKLGQYETIYDPTRLNVGDETHQASGQMGEGETQQVQLDSGLGDAYGQVPYHQVIYSYQEAANKAAEQALLPEAILQWVDGYFQALID